MHLFLALVGKNLDLCIYSNIFKKIRRYSSNSIHISHEYCVCKHHLLYLFKYFPFYSNNQFTYADVIVQPDSLTEAGPNTVVNMIIKEPGQNNAVSDNIVEDALYQTLQLDNKTVLTNLTLQAIVNAPIVSVAEQENALRVILPNTAVNEVSVKNITEII